MINKTGLYRLLPGFWVSPGEIALLMEGKRLTPESPVYWRLHLKGKPDLLYIEDQTGKALDAFLIQYSQEVEVDSEPR